MLKVAGYPRNDEGFEKCDKAANTLSEGFLVEIKDVDL